MKYEYCLQKPRADKNRLNGQFFTVNRPRKRDNFELAVYFTSLVAF